MKNKKKTNFLLYLFFGFALLMAIIDLFPFIWSLYTSFRPMSEVYDFNINVKNLTLDSYSQIFSSFPVFKWYFNSIFVAIVVTIGSILMNSAAGYALARLDFPGKKFIFICVLAVMMIPGQVIMIPTYMMISKLGWVNTYTGLTVPFFFSAFNVFMMRQFYISFPKELEEAGEIDGLSKFKTFFKIALPLSKPIIATMALFYLVFYWNNWFDAFLYLDSPEKWPVAYYLRQLISSASSTADPSATAEMMQISANIKSCAMVLTAAPIICVYPFIQKYFVQGMMLGGVKG